MGYIIYSPEYLQRLKFYSDSNDRLGTPKNLMVSSTTVYFDKVENAESYSVFVDHIKIGDATPTVTGVLRYLFNEDIEINDDLDLTLPGTFICNGTEYTGIRVQGRNTANNGLFNVCFIEGVDEFVLAYEESSDSKWKLQSYREITFNSSQTNILAFCSNPSIYNIPSTSIQLPERLSIDMSTLDDWDLIINNTTHIVQLSASATGYSTSFISLGTIFGTTFTSGIMYGPYVVTRVVDGDTIVCNINGVDSKIRLIGVNTPESVANGNYKVENSEEGCTASEYSKSMLTGKSVYLSFDIDLYDKYNRYLGYVFTDKGNSNNPDNNINYLYNNKLIELGWGEAQYYAPNGHFKTLFNNTQSIAKNNNEGFWGTGYFPTTLDAPTVTANNEYIKFTKVNNATTYTLKFKKSSYIVANIDISNSLMEYYTNNYCGGESPFTVTNSEIKINNYLFYEIAMKDETLEVGQTYTVNVVAKPIDSTHSESKNSNSVNVTVPNLS